MGNLNLTQVSASQNNKETTINDADDALDLALTDFENILVDNTNARALTASEWTRNMLFTVADDSPAPTGDITLTVPSTVRCIFTVLNNSSQNVTITSATQITTPPTIEPGAIQILSYGGTNVRPLALSTIASGNGALAGGNTVVNGFIPAAHRGALVNLTADETNVAAPGFPGAALNWDQTVYDTDGIWSAGNPSRLTVPTGVTKVRVLANVTWIGEGASSDVFTVIRKNGADFAGQAAVLFGDSVVSNRRRQNVISPVLEVSGGDYFEVNCWSTQTDADDIDADNPTWFAMEVVETTESAALTSQVVTLPARFIGATVSNAADLTAQDFSAGGVITWDTDDIDTDAFHDTGSNTERLTVPNGVAKVRVSANVRLNGILTGDDYSVRIRKNGADFPGGAEAAGTSASTVVEASVISPVVEVTAGDYFDVFVDTETDTSVDVDALASSFSIEVVEAAGASSPPTAYIAQKVHHRGAVVKSNTAQSITTATDNQVEFDTAVQDTQFQPNDAGSPQRFWLGADQTFVDGNVTVAADTIGLTGHGFTTGEGPVRLTTTGTLPTGLATGTDYWIIVVDANTIQLATTRANALAGTQVVITAAAGGGTHTVETETWIVVPANVTRMQFIGHVALSGSTGDAIMALHKNGAIVDGGFQIDHANTTDPDQLTAASSVLDVSEGDRFELVINPAAGTVTLDNTVLDTFLAAEVVDTDFATAFPGVTVHPAWQGARATLSGNFSASTTGAWTNIVWGAEDEDTDGFHSTSSNQARLTVPAGKGITRVRVKASVEWANISSIDEVALRINHFDSTGTSKAVVGEHIASSSGGYTNKNHHLESPTVAVEDGDFFTVQYFINQAETINDQPWTWFEIEVVETTESARPPHQIEVYLDTAAWDTAAFPTSVPIYKMVACRRFSLLDDLANSQGQADNGPNGGSVTIDVQRNGSSIGSIVFADSTGAAQTATFSTTGSVQEDFEIGDRLELVGPANWQSMDEIVISLFAFRS